MIAGSLEIQMAANVARLQKDMAAAKKTVSGAMGGINDTVEKTKRLLVGLGAGISVGALLNNLKRVAVETDQLRGNLVTVTGSIDSAGKAFDSLTQFASKTPFTLDQSVNAFIKLKALGLDPSERALASYGNTASAMGKSMSQMIEAVADASTNEFERLKEFGIKARQEGDNVTFTFQGVSTTIAKESKQIQEYLLAIGENQFGDAMANQMERLPGLLSNLEDGVDGFFRAIADQGGTQVIGGAIRTASSLMSSLTDNVDDVAVSISGLRDTTVIAFSGIHDSFVLTSGVLDSVFGQFVDNGIMSLKSFKFAFLDTLGVSGEKGIGTIQTVARAWSIGLTNMVAGVQTLGVRVGSTFDHIKLFFGIGADSALEFAQGIEKINLATTGAQRQIQNSANATFSALDDLRDEIIENQAAAKEFSATTGIAATNLEDLAGAADEAEGELQGVNGALSETDKSSAVAAVAVKKVSDEIDRQSRMLENVQREWGNLIYDLFSKENAADIGDFFDTIAKGFARMVSEMAAADLAKAVFGGGGLGALTNGNVVGLFTGQSSGDSGDFSLSSLASGAGLLKSASGLFKGGGSSVPGSGAGNGAWADFYGGGGGSSGGLSFNSWGSNAAVNVGAGLVAGYAGSAAGNAAGQAIFDKQAESAIGATVGGAIGSMWGPLGTAVGSFFGGMLDSATGGDGYTRSSAGFLTAPTAGASGNTFSVNAFASGFKPVGFADKASQQAAIDAINVFRELDQSLVTAINAAGGFVNMSRATLSGVNGDGQAGTSGTFFGVGGKSTEADLAAMATGYAKQLVDHIEGLSPDVMAQLTGARDAAEISSILADLSDANDSNTSAIEKLTEAMAAKEKAENALAGVAPKFAALLGTVDGSNKAQREAYQSRKAIHDAHAFLSSIGLSDVALGSSTGITPDVAAQLQAIYESGDVSAANDFALANPQVAASVGYEPPRTRRLPQSNESSDQELKVNMAIMASEMSEMRRTFKDFQVRGMLTRTS